MVGSDMVSTGARTLLCLSMGSALAGLFHLGWTAAPTPMACVLSLTSLNASTAQPLEEVGFHVVIF